MEKVSIEDTLERVSITHLSNAHNDWLRALHFYRDELKILNGRLTEIAQKNTARDVMIEVEHFENQFIIQAENINRLSHEIKANINLAAKEAKASGAGYIDGILLDRHGMLGNKFETEEKIINELRRSFNQFASEWM